MRTKDWYPAAHRVGSSCHAKLDRVGATMHGPGDFDRRGADGVLMCVRIPPCMQHASPVLPAAQLPLIAVAAGEFHVCVLDRYGALYCYGARDACQYIPMPPISSTGWQRARLPWAAEARAVYAAGNLTCVATAHSVFCTGCTPQGCLCRTAATTTSAAGVHNVTVTPGSYCIDSDTARCEGAPTARAPARCMLRSGDVMCGDKTWPVASALHVAASDDMIVVTTYMGMCTSIDNMDTLTCT